MYEIRRVEEKVADLSLANEIKTPVHLGIGQEAVAVGVSNNIKSTDRIYSGHRGHSHYLALGAPVESLFAEILGKSTGTSCGMGGSMHLVAREYGFHGSVPIVGATIPIAVGAAIASKLDLDGSLAVAYFGDGACEEGVLHESLNFASVMNLPIIFVCENNLYSSHLDIHLRQPSNKVSRFAEAHKVETKVVDGNDVVKIAEVASAAALKARSGGGPTFIEAVTYRWRGHVGPNSDLDVGVLRSKKELDAWKKRDPLGRLKRSLLEKRNIEEKKLNDIEKVINNEISNALDLARNASLPNEKNLLDFVYYG